MSESNDFQLQLPGYRIERELGRGAMAKVYLAVHLGLQRQVALKIMAPALVSNPTFRERFQREAQFVAQLDHPNIVTVFDIGVHENIYYMAMRYIASGITLKDRIGAGIDEASALTVMRQIAGALHCAHSHQRRIVHRDVKPANILFDGNGNAVLSDFGIAKSTGGSGQEAPDEVEHSEDALTMVGQAVGTPAYMSPDQILDRPLDARSDLYSLGVVFFEMLTGHKPFVAEETIALAMMQVNEPIPRLPKPQRKYQPIIDRLMAKKPEQRYASAIELIEALDQIARPTSTSLINPSVLPAPGADGGQGRPSLTAAIGATLTKTEVLAESPHWPRRLLIGGVLIAAVGLALRYGSPYLPSITPACTPPVLDQAAEKMVTQLLEVATLNREVGRLVFPDFSNAAYGYDQVLQINPCHAEAKQQMNTLPGLLAEQVRKAAIADAASGEDLALLRPLVEAGLRWWPEHPELLALRQQLATP